MVVHLEHLIAGRNLPDEITNQNKKAVQSGTHDTSELDLLAHQSGQASDRRE